MNYQYRNPLVPPLASKILLIFINPLERSLVIISPLSNAVKMSTHYKIERLIEHKITDLMKINK